MNTEFIWTTELAKELCEYVGLRVGKNIDIRNQVELLTNDFIASKTKPKEYEIIERFNYGDVPCDCDLAPIKSVRRLSDNELFSIDELVLDGKIGEFKIDDDGNIIASVCLIIVNEGEARYWSKLSSLKKAKPTLFTTEDGVAIKEGDDFWYANTHVWKSLCIDASTKSYDYVVNVNKYKTFSTEEKSLEYINLNKVRFSLKDIHEAMYLEMNQTLDGAYNLLAQSKIKTHE